MKKLLLLIFLSVTSANAQSLNDIFRESKQAFANKDYVTFLRLTQKLDSMRPMHPSFSYNLASAYALNNEQEKTFNTLKRIALMDNRVSITNDETFAGFIKTDYYNKFQQLRTSQDIIVSNSEKQIALSEKLLHPEGLVYLPGTGWLATSVRKRKIVSFDIASGNCTDWLAEKDMLAVFSVRISKDGKYLWAATAAIPEMENYDASLEGKAEVLKIDIAAKKVIKRFSVEGNHVFGDLVTGSGVVYISDSTLPVIYKIENDTIAEWLDLSREAYNLQGITIDEKETVLFVADYLKGITAISIKDKKHSWFTFPEGTTPKGIDGLTYCNNSLFAIHNGVTPIRIVQYKLNDAKKGITNYTITDRNRAEFNEPVLGTIHKDGFYFFANSPWKAYDKYGVPDESKVGNPELFVYKFKK